MAECWYYRLLGDEMGPVTLEQLKQLVQNGTLWDVDEIRSSDSDAWVYVSSMNWTKPADAGAATSSAEAEAENPIGSTWYCLIGETELGPWTFDELALFAASRQLSADDQVKMGENGKWRKVGSIGRLMALLPYDANDDSSGTAAMEHSDVATELFPISNGEDPLSLQSSVSELLAPKATKPQVGKPNPPVTNRIENEEPHAQEPRIYVEKKGRRPIEEESSPLIAEMALLDQLLPATNEEQVELKEVEEEDEVEVPTRAPQASPAPPKPAKQDVYQQAKAVIAQTMLAQANAAFRVSEEQAKTHIAWADGPDVDRFWYGWAGGVEFGPVEFSQVFGLAKSGQLKPTDFVRNGEYSQFTPSSNVPGLFTAVAMINKAAETLELAKSQILSVTSLAGSSP